jgi:hypothetical protein
MEDCFACLGKSVDRKQRGFRIVENNNKGHAVAQFVKALRSKPEGRGFDSRWFHWNLSLS